MNKSDYVEARDRVNLTVGDVIKMSCELNEISQAELSKRTGIPESNISEMIHGKRSIGKAIAQKLAKSLNVSPAFILFAGEAPRDGADIYADKMGAHSKIHLRKMGLLLKTINTLKENENKRAEKQRIAMRNAIKYLTLILQPSDSPKVAPLDLVAHSERNVKRAHLKARR